MSPRSEPPFKVGIPQRLRYPHLSKCWIRCVRADHRALFLNDKLDPVTE